MTQTHPVLNVSKTLSGGKTITKATTGESEELPYKESATESMDAVIEYAMDESMMVSSMAKGAKEPLRPIPNQGGSTHDEHGNGIDDQPPQVQHPQRIQWGSSIFP